MYMQKHTRPRQSPTSSSRFSTRSALAGVRCERRVRSRRRPGPTRSAPPQPREAMGLLPVSLLATVQEPGCVLHPAKARSCASHLRKNCTNVRGCHPPPKMTALAGVACASTPCPRGYALPCHYHTPGRFRSTAAEVPSHTQQCASMGHLQARLGPQEFFSSSALFKVSRRAAGR